jgi:hypothetical protein
MVECINHSAEWCIADGLRSLVIFTGTGDGPKYAADSLLTQDKYKDLRVIAVTPPFGRIYRATPGAPDSPLVRAGINPAMRDSLSALGIQVVAAHLPFKEVQIGRSRESEWSRVADAYGVLGGGFALCIQAVLVACDAGAIESGERVVALGADTSFVATACRTESFLSPFDGLLVEHIICRPLRYQISKRDHYVIAQASTLAAPETPPQLSAAPAPEHPTSRRSKAKQRGAAAAPVNRKPGKRS